MSSEIESALSSGNKNERISAPVRGSLTLAASSASSQATAGTDFSIFVVVKNPFDVPLTLYDVRTHIPVELIDVNKQLVKTELETAALVGSRFLPMWLRRRLTMKKMLHADQTGIASAVGTTFSPAETADFIKSNIVVHSAASGSLVTGVQMNFPDSLDADRLDQIMRRWVDYRAGMVAVRLQPGDEVVRQFRLRTRRWLLFTPLSHNFRIEAEYSVDGVDHWGTVPFAATIQARLSAIALGGMIGAIMGGMLKLLTDTTESWSVQGSLQALAVAVVASLAVVVGFARKSGSQAFVTVEDFWGGSLIGFSVGFVGYTQFLSLFS